MYDDVYDVWCPHLGLGGERRAAGQEEVHLAARDGLQLVEEEPVEDGHGVALTSSKKL